MKKEKVKKIKQPRKRRATTNKKVGPKDKSVKQNVNVNVTSSGGGGSGGSAIPSAQPSYNPFITSSMQGQKQGENIEIKRLTDLLNKSLSQASKPPQNIVEKATEKIVSATESRLGAFGSGEVPRMEEPKMEMREQPLFEGDEFKENIRLERKPDLSNLSLLQNINTNKIFDDALKVNVPEIVEDAENINVEEVFEKPNEISEPFDQDNIDLDNYAVEDYSPEQLKELKKFVKQNSIKLNKLVDNTFEYYKEMGKVSPVLEDEYGKFKIIDGTVIYWDSVRNRPLKRYITQTLRDHYFNKPNAFAKKSDNEFIKIKDDPKPMQIQLLEDYLAKTSKPKKTKKSKKDKDLAGQDIEL